MANVSGAAAEGKGVAARLLGLDESRWSEGQAMAASSLVGREFWGRPR